MTPPAELVEALAGVRHGVLVVGGVGVGSTDALVGFAERVGWPVIAEPHSGARHGPMALRSTDGVLRDEEFTNAHPPDLVVVVGRVGLSRALLGWLSGVRHIILSPDGGNWDVTRTAQAVIRCPLEALTGLDARTRRPWLGAGLASGLRSHR